MNYYLVIIQNDETCAVYKYADYDDALAAMHTELAYRGGGRTQTLCLIVKGDSMITNIELWKKAVAEE